MAKKAQKRSRAGRESADARPKNNDVVGETPRCIIVMSSGGDAPGMNACIRGVFRIARNRYRWRVLGVREGFEGLVRLAVEQQWSTPTGKRQIFLTQSKFRRRPDTRPAFLLDDEAVRGILKMGGTILGTARYGRFKEDPRLRANVRRALKGLGVTGAIVIGGDGSLNGAKALHSEDPQSRQTVQDRELGKNFEGPHTVGIPASIDNDIWGTLFSLGADTARNTIISAINNITDTADATSRTFILKVMGRNCGYLALSSALAAGAQFALIPEEGPLTADDINQMVQGIREQYDQGRRHCVIVLAEGKELATGEANIDKFLRTDLANHARGVKLELDPRVTELGHVQRGGMPTAFDRELAFRFAEAAVVALSGSPAPKGPAKRTACCVVFNGSSVSTRPLQEVNDMTRDTGGRMPDELRIPLRKLHQDLNALE